MPASSRQGGKLAARLRESLTHEATLEFDPELVAGILVAMKIRGDVTIGLAPSPFHQRIHEAAQQGAPLSQTGRDVEGRRGRFDRHGHLSSWGFGTLDDS